MIALELGAAAAFCGVGVLLALVPLQARLSSTIAGLRTKAAGFTDERVRVTGALPFCAFLLSGFCLPNATCAECWHELHVGCVTKSADGFWNNYPAMKLNRSCLSAPQPFEVTLSFGGVQARWWRVRHQSRCWHGRTALRRCCVACGQRRRLRCVACCSLRLLRLPPCTSACQCDIVWFFLGLLLIFCFFLQRATARVLLCTPS